MRSITAFAAVGLYTVAIQGVAATWWRDHQPYNVPQNYGNKCDDKESKGYDWGDLPDGDFNNYNGYSFSGYKAGGKYTKRSIEARTFGGRYISCDLDSDDHTNEFKHDQKDFSINNLDVSTDYDTDVEFHYGMPDGSTCKKVARCGKQGTSVGNDQCGGAKSVKIKLPKHKGGKKKCGLKIHKIKFECKDKPKQPETPKNPCELPPKCGGNYGNDKDCKLPDYCAPPTPEIPNCDIPDNCKYNPNGEGCEVPKECLPDDCMLPPRCKYNPNGYGCDKPLPSTCTPPGSSEVPTPPASTSGSPPPPPSSASEYPSPSSSGSPPPPAESSQPPSPSPSGSPPPSPSSSGSPPPPSSGPASVPPSETPKYPSSSGSPPPPPSSSGSPPPPPSSGPPAPPSETPKYPSSSGSPPPPASSGSPPPPPSSQPSQYPSTSGSPPPPPSSSGSPPPPPSSSGSPPPPPSSSGSPPPPPSSSGSPPPPTTQPPVPTYPSSSGSPPPPPSSSGSPPPPPPPPQCPDTVPRCVKTWLFMTECIDNAQPECYCPNKEFVKMVYDCMYAYGKDDDEVSKAAEYFLGICNKYVPKNPDIVGCVPPVVVPQPIPTGVPTTTYTQTYTTVVPCEPTTVTEGPTTYTQTETTTTTTKTLTVPQVTFTLTSSDVELVYPSPAGQTPAPTGPAPSYPTGSAGPTTLVKVPVPTNTASPSLPDQFTSAGSILSPAAGLITLAGAIAVVFFQL